MALAVQIFAMKTILTMFVFLTLSPAATAESVYTKLKLDACPVVDLDEGGGRGRARDGCG